MDSLAGWIIFLQDPFHATTTKERWSKINRERAERLIKSGRMMKRGQSEIDRAITDGRWQAAYASQSKAVPHADLQAALDRDACAREAFEALDSPIAIPSSIECTKRRRRKNVRRRSLSCWLCSVAAKRSTRNGPEQLALINVRRAVRKFVFPNKRLSFFFPVI